MVTTAGSASGIAATPKLTEVKNINNIDCPCSKPTTNTTIHIASTVKARYRPKPDNRVCKGVFTLVSSCSSPAIWPISVSMPLATTTPLPRPRIIMLFLKTRFKRSPMANSLSASGSVCFSIACDSPVRVDSSTSSSSPSSKRTSAGTRFPASSITTSPGTNAVASIVTSSASRNT